jgi:dolichol kinase
MNLRLKSGSLRFNSIALFAILLIVLIATLAGAVVVRAVRDIRQWRKFRTLVREWAEDREKRESP